MSAPKESFREQMRGFPYLQLTVIAFVRIAEPIAFTSLFPYVYFMVKDFGIADSDADVSKYSGYLSSCFALCQVLTTVNWGRFADIHGRKPTLFIGLTGSIVSLLILGFSKNFYMALTARCMMGLLNGNVAVLRTMIGEVATERKHQALAFSIMPLIGQVGSVIGPLIGGYLSGKTTRFQFLEGLVSKYHYALPNIVISLILGFSLLTAIFFMEETHHKHHKRHDFFVDIGDLFLKKVFGLKIRSRPWHSNQLLTEETALIDEESSTSVYDGSDEDDIDDVQSIEPVLTRRESVALVRTYSTESKDEISYRELFAPHIFYAIICNFIMALHIVVHDEFLPVFLAYDVAKNENGELISKLPLKLAGGLGFSSEDTGQLLSSTGVLGIFFILVVFPWVDRHYDCLTTYRRFIMIFPLLYFLIPFDVFLAAYPKTVAKLVVYSMTCLKTLGTAISFPQILLIVNNSCDKKHRALVNGATFSVSAFARFSGPLIWGYLMSIGQKYESVWMSWWSLSLVALLAIYQSRYLRDSIE